MLPASTQIFGSEMLQAAGPSVGYNEAEVQKRRSQKEDLRRAFGWPQKASHDLLSKSLALYEFTTENIAEYLPLLDASGKRCLTIAASGDQAINLLMAGAKEVTTFDSSLAAGEVTWLKIQALSDLDWADRHDFSRNVWKKVFEPLTFARLMDRADKPNFGLPWSTLRNAVCGLPEDCVAAWIFPDNKISGTVPYLRTDDAFRSAQSACRAAMEAGASSFIQNDIRTLPFLSLGEFDVIVLSNVLQAVFKSLRPPQLISRNSDHQLCNESLQTAENLKSLVNSMIWPVARMLSPGGVMMASYTYDCDSDFTDGEIYDPPLRTNPLQATVSRRTAFKPIPGFTVEEHWGEAMNSASSGVDVMVMIRRDI